MVTQPASLVIYAGAVVGLGTLCVATFNAWKAVSWKRAELASSYLKELTTNQELAFACRALEWNGGRLAVPESLAPLLLSDKRGMAHDLSALERAMDSELTLDEMEEDERLQIYRTAVDSLLSWLSVVAHAIERNLFGPEDLQEARYWVQAVHNRPFLDGFIRDFGYDRPLSFLREKYAVGRSPPPAAP